jgi:hypothetical protein
MIMSSGRIRFLRSDSRNSATVLASTPALLAARPAVRAVVFAPLRAFCWRARAWPPFLAAALRFAALGPDELERERPDELALERDLLAADDDLLLLRPEDLLLDDLLPDDLLPPERLELLLRFPLLPPRCCAISLFSLFDLDRTRGQTLPARGLFHAEAREDGRVVGQPDRQAVGAAQLALLGR